MTFPPNTAAAPGLIPERSRPGSACWSHLVDLVFEAQDLGQRVQHVDGEAFVPLGLPQDVVCHHDEGILLQRHREEAGLQYRRRRTQLLTAPRRSSESRFQSVNETENGFSSTSFQESVL